MVGALVASSGLLGSAASPAVAASKDALSTSLPVDPKSTLTVQPPAYDNTVVIVATFAKPYAYKNRVVSLQRQDGAGWKEVKAAKTDASGAVEFRLTRSTASPYDTYTYRAVTEKFKYKKKWQSLATTQTVVGGSQWTQSFLDDFTAFDGTSWATRSDGVSAGSRQCSMPRPENVGVKSGALLLSMDRATGSLMQAIKTSAQAAQQAEKDATIQKAQTAVNKAKAQLAAAKTKAAKKKANAALKKAEAALKKAKASKLPGCPKGVYSNAMVSTEGKVTFTEGIVAAKVKFPKAKGMHGSAWLQSAAGQEIDFIESYGYGKGVASVVHVRDKNGKLKKSPSKDAAGYVLKSDTKKSKWWDKAHVFSVEIDGSQVIFRIDGKVTRTMKNIPAQKYFLVLSLLSSDWELPLLKKQAKGVKLKYPTTMTVDWVQAWQKKAA
jgi:beta-glucanase (GH16 family)